MTDERRRMNEVLALVRKGRRREALDAAEAALESYPESVGLRALRADILLKIGDLSKAGREIRWLLARRPDHPRILSLGGDLHRLEHRFDEAAQLYLRSLDLREDGYVRNRAVDMLLRLDRLADAERLIAEGLKKHPDDPWLLRRRARLLAARGENLEAVKILERSAGDDPAAFRDYADALRLRLEAFPEQRRLNELSNILAVPTHRSNPWLHALAAELALDQGLEARARRHLDRAKSLNPSDPHLWKTLGFLYNRLHAWADVLDTLGQAFIAEPRDVVSQQVLFAAAKKGADWAKLKAVLERAYEAHPGFHKLNGLIRKVDKTIGESTPGG